MIGATPRGQPRMPAMMLPHGCEGLRVWRRTVLWTLRRPFMGRPVPRQLLRNALLDLTTIMPATAYHRRSYARDTVGLWLNGCNDFLNHCGSSKPIRIGAGSFHENPCNATGNGSGSDRLPTWSSPWVGSSSHAGSILLPECSKLFQSHWSHQWLTANTELHRALDTPVRSAGHGTPG